MISIKINETPINISTNTKDVTFKVYFKAHPTSGYSVECYDPYDSGNSTTIDRVLTLTPNILGTNSTVKNLTNVVTPTINYSTRNNLDVWLDVSMTIDETSVIGDIDIFLILGGESDCQCNYEVLVKDVEVLETTENINITEVPLIGFNTNVLGDETLDGIQKVIDNKKSWVYNPGKPKYGVKEFDDITRSHGDSGLVDGFGNLNRTFAPSEDAELLYRETNYLDQSSTLEKHSDLVINSKELFMTFNMASKGPCPAGYELSGNTCYREVFSCPKGFEKRKYTSTLGRTEYTCVIHDEFLADDVPNDANIYVFYDTTSLGATARNAAKTNIELWYQNYTANVNSGYTGNLYHLAVGASSNNGEDWLAWASYPWLGVLTSSTESLSGKTLGGFTFKNTPYTANWCTNDGLGNCIWTPIFLRGIAGFNELPSSAVGDNLGIGDPYYVSTTRAGHAVFSGQDKNVVCIMVEDESTPAGLPYDSGRINSNQPSHKFLTDYEQFLGVYQNYDFFQALVYPFPGDCHFPLSVNAALQARPTLNKYETFGTNGYPTSNGGNCSGKYLGTSTGYFQSVLTVNNDLETINNNYVYLSASTVYQALPSELKNGAGLENFGFEVNNDIFTFTPEQFAGDLDDFFVTEEMTCPSGYELIDNSCVKDIVTGATSELIFKPVEETNCPVEFDLLNLEQYKKTFQSFWIKLVEQFVPATAIFVSAEKWSNNPEDICELIDECDLDNELTSADISSSTDNQSNAEMSFAFDESVCIGCLGSGEELQKVTTEGETVFGESGTTKNNSIDKTIYFDGLTIISLEEDRTNAIVTSEPLVIGDEEQKTADMNIYRGELGITEEVTIFE
jgi:hypothetical protein